MVMADDEPSFREFLLAVLDSVASNELVDALRRKFQAQSYFEFFNRLSGIALLIFMIGFSGWGLVIYFQDSNISVSLLDFGNVLYIVGIALILWILMYMVRVVNTGETPLYHDEPTTCSELIKIMGGIIFIGSLLYQFIWVGNAPITFIIVSLLGAVLTAIWLLGIAWILGGVSGLVRIYRTR